MGPQVSGSSDKSGLRRALSASRRTLSAGERAARSRAVWAALAEIPAFREASLVCTYVSYREEVETREPIRTLLVSGRRVAVPAHFHGEGLPLVFSEIRSWSELAPNHFGILQPTRRHLRPLPTSAIPVFLVPGLAFDECGRRLGYGLGFYDRVLCDAAPGALKIALAFDLQVVEAVPAEDHDVPMDLIVTETRVIRSRPLAAPA